MTTDPIVRPILLFGPTGQLGRSLAALSDRMRPVGRDQIDLATSGDAIGRLIAAKNVSAVINAAAWTAVDLAEAEPERARQVNFEAPWRMAEACHTQGIPLVHVSTDYVFDGSKNGAWVEDDPAVPLNVYGRTKLEGEQAVLDVCPGALVIRTSWVVSEFGRNFVRTMLSLADRPTLRIVGDQVGVPTDARELARFILHALETHEGPGAAQGGRLHFRNSGGAITWAEFAGAIFEAAGGPRPSIEAISTEAYGASAPRPKNSVLDIGRLERTWGWTPATWRESLGRIVAAIQAEAA